MSCGQYQIDLSRCLDGRVPGARRAQVMAHADTCPKCAQVREELQAARSLVFGLQQPAVSPGFRDEVWNRIHSGEGAPEVVLQAPVTVATKIRYGLVGAAAAAALLFGLQLLARGDTPNEPAPDDDLVAKTVDDQGRQLPIDPVPPGPRPVSDMVNAYANEAIAAGHLATRTVDKVATAAKRLRLRKRVILGNQHHEPRFLQEVNHDIQTIDAGLFVLDTLQRRQLVELEAKSRECMRAARVMLDTNRADTQQQMVNLVKSLDQCSLDGLPESFHLRYSGHQFTQPEGMMFGMFADNPQLIRILAQLGLVQPQGLNMWMIRAPGVRQQFVLRIETHSSGVAAPRTPNAEGPRAKKSKKLQKRSR